MKRRCARRGKFFSETKVFCRIVRKKKDNGGFVDTPLPIGIVHDVVTGGLDFFHNSRAGQFVLACDFVEFNADVFFIFSFQKYFKCSFQNFSL